MTATTKRLLATAAVTAAGLATVLLARPAAAATDPPAVAYVRSGDVYVAAGSTVRRLTTDGTNARPRWSPDGTRLAYLHAGGVWVMDDDGGHKQRAAPGTGAPSW